MWVNHKSMQEASSVDYNPFYYTPAYAGQLGFGFFAEFEQKSDKNLLGTWVSHKSMRKASSVDCNPFYYTPAYAGQLGFGFFAEFETACTASPRKSR